MGKTPKKAAPGGDERNLYVRRVKPTTAPSKASETSLPERQRESESSNRPTYSGVQKKVSTDQLKGFKNKLQSPGSLGLGHPPKRLGRPPRSMNKKKLVASVKATPAQTSSMQPESEDAEVKSDATLSQNETTKEESVVKTSSETVEPVVEKEETNNGVSEETCPSDDRNGSLSGEHGEQVPEELPKNEPENADGNLEENVSKEIGEPEECEGNGIKLALEEDDNQACPLDKDQKEEPAMEETQQQACEKDVNGGTEKEEQNGSQTDTESYSVDIVESTTSEISEASECPSRNETPKDKEQADKVSNDASFISYDSNIMLKDVKIKLNDCLKENPKLYEASNAEASLPGTPMKDMSFGKTLRNISGRHSLSRMRHVTLRERRFSPNNSMYVNTSSASLPADETSDLKSLHHRSGVDESQATNGSLADRKRKLDSESWFSAKKQKTESGGGLLNASIDLLKGMRKPVQISTPNVHAQKCHSSNLDISEISDDGVAAEQTDGSRKWCTIM